MEYKVIDFPPSNDPGNALKKIIDTNTAGGWEYVNHQYSDKLVPGGSGCFGIGATPPSTAHIGFVIFKK